MLKIRNSDVKLNSATMHLAGSIGQSRLTTNWPGKVKLPARHKEVFEVTVDGVTYEWTFVAQSASASYHGLGNWTQTVQWKPDINDANILRQLVQGTHNGGIGDFVRPITKWGVRRSGNGFDVLPFPDTNDLGRWTAILAPLPGNWDGPIRLGSVITALNGGSPNIIEEVASGRWLSEYIEIDLLQAVTLQDAERILNSYQIGLQIIDDMPVLRALTDAPLSNTTFKEIKTSAWDENDNIYSSGDYRIGCQFYTIGEENRQVFGVGGSFTTSETLGGDATTIDVQEPAGSIEEAELEISLQQVKIDAERFRAGATIPLNPAVTVYDWLRVQQSDMDWLALSITHEWPAGNAPETTQVKLRGFERV